MELWGGHEPTINRVGDVYFDQSRLNGHDRREADIELFAELGIKALRYPALWEAIAPHRPDTPDFAALDLRMASLRDDGPRPIVGLIHHGAGPPYAGLLTDEFAPGLAAHAEAVARRYPWVEDWIPVNEPLTTARFSAQYGHWHPHARDETLFWRALLNQIDAVRGAMHAVRRVNPKSRLIQTEDLGRTYSARSLRDQAEFDNQRRWMTWDLLCGRVDRDHFFWSRLEAMGLGDRLRAILDDPCPPAVIGINHYLTSDRFLDPRLERYPADRHGGNGRVYYADIEAIRVMVPAPDLIAGALREAWERYGIPLAITEVHNGCTREEQLRWIAEAWTAARACNAAGARVEAVTAWALLGSHNWRTLLREHDGSYEPGAFDVRGRQPRPTAIARLLREIADEGDPKDPLALGEGWWRRDVRLLHEPVARIQDRTGLAWARRTTHARPRPLLIAGASGTLGQAFARACELRGLDYVLTDRRQLPLEEREKMVECLRHYQPWAVVNTAGFVRVDEAESDPGPCLATNTFGALDLAKACGDMGVPTVSFSSDLVFDGLAGRPLVETDLASPICVYGRSKAEMEHGLRDLGAHSLIVRTAAFFSSRDPFNFAHEVVRRLSNGVAFEAANDLIMSPTHVPEMVNSVLDLLIDGEDGIWHVTNGGAISWADFASGIAAACGLDRRAIRGVSWTTLGLKAPRPPNVALATERGASMSPLSEAIERFARELAAA